MCLHYSENCDEAKCCKQTGNEDFEKQFQGSHDGFFSVALIYRHISQKCHENTIFCICTSLDTTYRPRGSGAVLSEANRDGRL